MCVMDILSQENEWSCMCVMDIPSQENEWSCMCVMDIDFVSISMIFQLDVTTVVMVWYFCFSFYQCFSKEV